MWAPRVLCQRYTRTPGIVPQSYRSHRSSGLGYGDLTELAEILGTLRSVIKLTEVPGIVARAYTTHIYEYIIMYDKS